MAVATIVLVGAATSAAVFGTYSGWKQPYEKYRCLVQSEPASFQEVSWLPFLARHAVNIRDVVCALRDAFYTAGCALIRGRALRDTLRGSLGGVWGRQRCSLGENPLLKQGGLILRASRWTPARHSLE
jgi:hypothetical protein